MNRDQLSAWADVTSPAHLEAMRMLDWLSRLFRWQAEVPSPPSTRAPSSVHVHYDEKTITLVDGKDRVSSIAWADVASVTVVTDESEGPDVDLFWIICERDGRRCLTVPMDADGEHGLLVAMQARLAGFDNMAVVEAMSSTQHGEFRIWPAAEIA